jgi:Fur family ferric uptake transcriptional regulator
MQDSLSVFKEYLLQKGYKNTQQRLHILRAFLNFEGHCAAEELLSAARGGDPSVSQATVYRTLKLLCDAGLTRELHFGDGRTRFERRLEAEEHHDHLICESCGRTIEFFNAGIERLQEELARLHNFAPTRHRLYLYGICPACREAATGVASSAS